MSIDIILREHRKIQMINKKGIEDFTLVKQAILAEILKAMPGKIIDGDYEWYDADDVEKNIKELFEGKEVK